ncbi:uncharacterized protein LOC108224490 [Daucus carota subsp. sativus]|uniref:Uncharacterized protein n=1 Tax=Daucus carota subsp. sativus TaxID=79200 RepID=A0A161ZVH6_DAUCS|nr:PREDICTED: glucose 1-dehydrogenase-like [Daucus carota subsp. sativus]
MSSSTTTQVSNQLEPWLDLDGKVVLVTGASSGLGWDFCINLAQANCKVIAAARRVDRLKSLCDQINGNSASPRAVAIAIDVTADPASIEAAVGKAWGIFGRVDCLINNAGIRGSTSSTIELTKEEWDNVFKTNLDGAWLCSKYIGIRMRDAGIKGSIINISSIFGLTRVQSNGSLAYSSSKAGMHAMTTVMALDFGPYDIRVNAIAPSIFQSEITKDLFQQQWLKDVVKKILPLQFTATVDPALTEVIRYLMHDSSKYITGNIFIVDSGTTLPGVPIFSRL